MTSRFLKRDFFASLRIVYAYVFKGAANNPAMCRELLFGDETAVSEAALTRSNLHIFSYLFIYLIIIIFNSYMDRFKLDSAVGLDVLSLGPLLPSKTAGISHFILK
jgi:hypothetical protein